MVNFRSASVSIILTIGLLSLLTGLAYAQLWHQFAHPNQPHPGTNGGITIPELFADPNAVVQLPVLVVLMEFVDVAHETQHDVAFFQDLMFGEGRPSGRPSVAQVYRENSNGRLLLTPATAGDQDGTPDGIVGWVTAQDEMACRLSDLSCVYNLSENQCLAQGGEWGSFMYWWCDIHAKRAEGIRVADPFFNYSVYDTNNDNIITSDELIVVLVNADDTACDQHVSHPNLPACTDQPGGNVRPTNPSQVPVEEGQLEVHQAMAGCIEQADVGVFAHELGHQVLGLGDLYEATPNTHVADGYLFEDATWYPPPPGPYSIMDSYRPDRVNHLDPWAKIHLGFVKPLVITHDGTYSLYDAETERSFSTQERQPEAMIIYDPLRDDAYKEYFILENRNQAELDDQGLAVWLINENGSNWPSGLDLRKVIRLIRREGHWPTLWYDDNMALWNGIDDTQGYDLTASSTPRNTSWTDGKSSYIEIYDISEAGPVMTFKVQMPPIFVDRSNTGFENGSQAKPFNMVSEGVAAVPEPPRTIRIAGGSYPETLVINTPCTLKGWRNGNAVIGQ
ncbi:MAG: hypothetical protein ACE5I2_11355 [Anaerolineae bacterium]